MLTLNDGRNELWQWDTGRTLNVDADCTQVHFSNKVFGRSIDMNVVDGIAIIPDILLQTDKDLIAWAFVGTAENGYTKISKVFKVNKRNKPADYVFTPPEQTSLEEIKEKLDYLESIQDPDAIKNAVEDYLEKNPVEAPVQSVNGKTGKVDLTAEDVGAISKDKLQEATNEALAQAKASGEFNGRDGDDGKDYVLTDADKSEIAEMAAELVDVPDSGGNVDLTGYATEQYVKEYAQPKGDYLTEVPEGYAKTEDIPTKPEDIGAQPEDDYALRSEIPSVPVQSVNGKTGAVQLSAADVKARPDDWMPSAQEVGALSENAMEDAVNNALAKAKESGEFDGKDGIDGKDGQPGKDGEPGKDYVLTSADKEEIAELASELVEVPEGGGIAVTGAKVGQTVKIAEVDENGVPTAWEAVDFPETYSKSEIDAIMGSYITDIDILVGGDS